MEQLCPYCGNALSHKDQCANCQNEVAWVKKCYLTSNYYYTKAYEAAKNKEFTMARILLEEAILFNKYNIYARNLLGLIYYEIGEIALGLKAWIVSSALEKENNVAVEYLEKVQNTPKILEKYKMTSRLYNEALKYLKQGTEDIAIIRLKKVVSVNPQFVEGRVLLALCYIKNKQFKKANEQLTEALKIDHNHTKAMAYMHYIREEGYESSQSGKQEEATKGERQISKVPVIDRNSLFFRYTLYFLVGVMCMWIAQKNLVIPSKIEGYKEQIINLQDEKETISKAMDTLKGDYEEQLGDLQVENERLKNDNAAYAETIGRKSQQEKLAQAQTLLSQRDYEGAAQLVYNMATQYLTEEENESYKVLKESAYRLASNDLCNKGYSLLQSGAFDEAKMSLEAALLYEPDEENKRRILYYLGRVEYGLGSQQSAANYFNQVIETYPNTVEANWSESRLNEIKSTQ